jgi:3alpha(or 20beta)-hydroxysteroid dehydrogenase
MGKLDGKRALVTGAMRGLGAEISRLFQSEGATVILSGREAICESALLDTFPGCEYWQLDVAEESHWLRAAEKLRERGDALHILVNNAAIVRHEPIANCSTRSFREVMDVNLMGVFFGIRELAPLMTHGASIVNISSCAGLEGINGACSYVASKWAVTGLTQAAALELGHRGIRVNTVHPRAMATPMIADNLAETGEQQFFANQAIPRIGQTVEVARMVAFLASDESSYCTGGAYPVDGGYMAGPVVASMGLS